MVSHAVWKTWPSGLSYDKNFGLRTRFLSTESLGPCFSHGMGDHDQILHYNMTVWILAGNYISFTIAAGLIIGIDHDTVCAGVVGTAIRNSTSCAGHRAAAPAGTPSAVPDCSTNHDSADRISGQFLFYHDHNLQKVRETCVFRRLVPLFVPIGVCVTTHDDGTASDVTIGMWRHNQQVTNHERNGKPWFSLPK